MSRFTDNLELAKQASIGSAVDAGIGAVKGFGAKVMGSKEGFKKLDGAVGNSKNMVAGQELTQGVSAERKKLAIGTGVAGTGAAGGYAYNASGKDKQ